jgi:hypothetical protein
MNAIERKLNSEKLLALWGIVNVDELPPIEESVNLRSPQDIAKRILILTYLNCVASEMELRFEIQSFLKKEGLWEHTSDVEKALFEKAELTDREEDMIRWRGESIWLLLWVLYKVDELDLPNTLVGPQDVFSRLPQFMNRTNEFIDTAKIRPLSDILDQSDLMFRLSWAMRHAEMNGIETRFNHDVVIERFYSLNWVTSVQSEWDVEPAN